MTPPRFESRVAPFREVPAPAPKALRVFSPDQDRRLGREPSHTNLQSLPVLPSHFVREIVAAWRLRIIEWFELADNLPPCREGSPLEEPEGALCVPAARSLQKQCADKHLQPRPGQRAAPAFISPS